MFGIGVMIATPAYDGKVCAGYASSLAQTAAGFAQEEIPFRISILPNLALLSHARNQLVAEFMAWSPGTHLLLADSDIQWQPDDVLTLLHHNCDVVAGIYQSRHGSQNFEMQMPRDSSGRPLQPLWPNDTGLIEIAACGLGFVCIKVEVFKKMFAAYPELKITAPEFRGPAAAFHYDLFRLVDSEYLGEDFSFCRRWRAIGGKIFCDPQIRLRHHGQRVYDACPTDFLGQAKAAA